MVSLLEKQFKLMGYDQSVNCWLWLGNNKNGNLMSFPLELPFWVLGKSLTFRYVWAEFKSTGEEFLGEKVWFQKVHLLNQIWVSFKFNICSKLFFCVAHAPYCVNKLIKHSFFSYLQSAIKQFYCKKK